MLNSFTIGNGKPHIWLHGLLGNCLNLSPLARGQPGQHFLLDARNHGNSFHRPGMDYMSQAEDVVRFMDTNSIEKAVILGHSMGGKTSCALALMHPNRVLGVCLMDIAPVSYLQVMDQYYGYIRQYLTFIKNTDVTNKTRKDVEILTQARFDDVRITQLIASNLKQTESGLQWRIGVNEIFQGIEDVGHCELKGVYNGPTLAIAGINSIHTCRSPLIPSGECLKSLYSHFFPQISIEIVPNAGHFIHVDNPSYVKASINKFLSTIVNN